MKLPEKICARTSSDIFNVMMYILKEEKRIKPSTREYFFVLALDDYFGMLNLELIGMGSIREVAASPPEIYSVPLQKKAKRIAIIHNHPSGHLLPSEADKNETNRLIQAGLILDIEVQDHLILGKNSYYSFRDSGLLKQLEHDPKYALTFTREKLLRRDMEQIKSKIEQEGFERGELTGVKKGKKEGKKEGIALGHEKGVKDGILQLSREIARQMIKEGEDIEKIVKYTKISRQWIGRLKIEAETLTKKNQ